ncbi:hypothetical protein ACFX13_043751 [Malus domestica]
MPTCNSSSTPSLTSRLCSPTLRARTFFRTSTPLMATDCLTMRGMRYRVLSPGQCICLNTTSFMIWELLLIFNRLWMGHHKGCFLHSFVKSSRGGMLFRPTSLPVLGLSASGDKQCIRDRTSIMARHFFADKSEDFINGQQSMWPFTELGWFAS